MNQFQVSHCCLKDLLFNPVQYKSQRDINLFQADLMSWILFNRHDLMELKSFSAHKQVLINMPPIDIYKYYCEGKLYKPYCYSNKYYYKCKYLLWRIGKKFWKGFLDGLTSSLFDQEGFPKWFLIFDLLVIFLKVGWAKNIPTTSYKITFFWQLRFRVSYQSICFAFNLKIYTKNNWFVSADQ